MATIDVERLRQIKTLPSLIKLLRDELNWPIEAEEIEDLTFDYAPEELGLDAKHAAKIKEIKQLRPLETHQPWGIFWVSFEKKRLPMVVLRRVLGNLVIKRRAGARKADRPSWHLHDLLFISSYGEEADRTLSFAHFSEDPETGQLPVLRVLGWDEQDSIMNLDRVANRLHSNLLWPDDPKDVDTWRERWSDAFTDRYREAIRSADVLIPRLAQLAGNIRCRVRDVLDAETERGPMRRLYAAVRDLLIHDMDEDAFADMYAQTVSYGLLSAAFSRQADIHPQNLVQLTAVSNPFLESLLENLFRLNRGRFHFDVDEVGINDVLDLLRNTNIEAIKAAFSDKNPAEDPVIRFYEGFLKEYDPKQRIKRGIFFTPRPVVSYIVRSVHELLQTEFGLEDGLASTVTWGEYVEAASSRLDTRQDAASTCIHYFDPDAPVAHLSGNLPHWRQQSTTYFVTFRLADSMPQEKLEQWLEERDAWLTANPEPHSPEQRRDYYERFPARFQAWLDQGYGSCMLGKPDIKSIVESTLRHFDGDRYRLDEFVVMPNHVHVVVTPFGDNLLSDTVHSWKSFSANEVNKRLGRTGRLWQKETFDHIVRSPESLRRIREYILYNPKYVETASSRLSTRQDAASTVETASGPSVETASSRLSTRQDAASTGHAASPIRIPEGAKPEDPFVCILDPAVGTATFLFECIEVIERTMKTKWARELRKPKPDDRSTWRDPEILPRWQHYVPRHLLPRLYGYELMMAPYAIAHLKLALKLGETGYQFREGDRLHIYLTNSLEPPSEVADSKLADLFGPLAREAQEVNDIKRNKRFTVVIGNPPYSGESANKIEWIERMVKDTYQCIDGVPIKEKGKKNWLLDDYVKFLRFSHLTVARAGCGIIAHIINNAFQDNPTFRGLRRSLLRDFSAIQILDLHGSGTRSTPLEEAQNDENVFDILQGVCVLIMTRPSRLRETVTVTRGDLWGPREKKCARLLGSTSAGLVCHGVQPKPEQWYLISLDLTHENEWLKFISLLDAMPVNGNGLISAKDHFAYAFTPAEFQRDLQTFLDQKLTDEQVAERLQIRDNSMWSLHNGRLRLRRERGDARLCEVAYRPFDFRHSLFHRDVIFNLRVPVTRHIIQGNNLVLLTTRMTKGGDWRHCFVTRHVSDCALLSNQTSTNAFVFPLRQRLGAEGFFATGGAYEPNLSPVLLTGLSSALAVPFKPASKDPVITPEDIFHYIYSVFYSPEYRRRYAELLKIDFPRVPLTNSLALFRALATLGGELVALHLMESSKLNTFITRWQGTAPSSEVEKVSYVEAASSRLNTRQDAASTVEMASSRLSTRQDAASAVETSAGRFQTKRQDAASTGPSTIGTVFIDKAQTQGFHGVPENVWNFHIGGYQVCHKWLDDRRKAGRSLFDDDITHYHKIVVALNETIRLMAEIDQVIEAHGGWPEAFASGS